MPSATGKLTANFDDVTWTITIRNSANVQILSVNLYGASPAYVWDGKDSASILQPDGLYTFQTVVTGGPSTITAENTVTVDLVFPVAAIDSPAEGFLLSNVHQNGSASVNITGSATDLNFLNWQLDSGAGASPTSWTLISSGTTAISSGIFLNWDSLPTTNGLLTLRLQVWDRAGNRSPTLKTITVGNFSMTQSTLQLNAATGGTVTYTSIIPFTLTQTLVIKNEAGNIVRTLFNGQRPAGTHNNVWNGRNDTGNNIPDGGYFYSSTVSDAIGGMNWDVSNQFLPGTYQGVYTTPNWDPFNNQPMTFTYNFTQTGRVGLTLSPTFVTDPYPGIPRTCDAPNICVFARYEETGPHTVTWSGADLTGAFRPDIKGYALGSWTGNFPKNAVVVFGSKPVIANSLVTVTPPLYNPGSGNQTLNFTLTTFQNQSVDVTVTFINQSSLSTLRTITVTGVAPGAVAIPWDGRADNGMPVAPGGYTVTVTVTDSIGNQVGAQILTTVQY